MRFNTHLAMLIIPLYRSYSNWEKCAVLFTLCILNVGVHSCHPGEFKKREIFYFLFTLKRLVANTFPDESKCQSYKGACLIKVIFNKKNPPLNHCKVCAIEKCLSCVM